MADGRGSLYKLLDSSAEKIFFVAVVAALVFMLLLFSIGLIELWAAVRAFDWLWLLEDSGASKSAPSINDSILATIKALELFILAPLPYVVLQGLGVYITCCFSDAENDRERAEKSLPQVKSLIASIFVSTIAVSLVGKVLDEEEPLTWTMVGTHLMIIVVLATYYFAIEVVAHSRGRHVGGRNGEAEGRDKTGVDKTT